MTVEIIKFRTPDGFGYKVQSGGFGFGSNRNAATKKEAKRIARQLAEPGERIVLFHAGAVEEVVRKGR